MLVELPEILSSVEIADLLHGVLPSLL